MLVYSIKVYGSTKKEAEDFLEEYLKEKNKLAGQSQISKRWVRIAGVDLYEIVIKNG